MTTEQVSELLAARARAATLEKIREWAARRSRLSRGGTRATGKPRDPRRLAA